jgi:hypothetical protein
MYVNAKLIPPQKWGGLRRVVEGVNPSMVYLVYIVKTFVNATKYPHPAHQ